MEEKTLRKLKNNIRFAGILSVVTGWLVIALYIIFTISEYAGLTAVQNVTPSIDIVAGIIMLAMGIIYIIFGNQLRKMKSVHFKDDIQILFYGSLILAILTVVGGSIPGVLLILLVIFLGRAADSVDVLIKEESFRSELKEDRVWLHQFFCRLNDLGYKRTILQAIGFYVAYVAVMIGIGGLLVGLSMLWLYFIKTSLSLQAIVPIVVSAVYLLGVAYLSFRILKAKNLWSEKRYIVIWFFGVLATLFLGGLFGLMVAAFLTMREKRHLANGENRD